MVALQDAGMLLELSHPRFVAHIRGVAVPHVHERRDGEAGATAVQFDAIAPYVTRLFQPLDALHHGGA